MALVAVVAATVIERATQSQTASPALAARSTPAGSNEEQKLAFASFSRPGSNGLFVVNADGSGKRQVASHAWGLNPSWSPDGRTIAFWSGPDGLRREVHAVNADGTGQRSLTRAWGLDGLPVWSRGGRKIAFTPNRGGRTDISVMNGDGSGQRRVSSSSLQPLWSPDGTMIAFTTARDGNREVYVVNADGSEGAKRLAEPNGEEGRPAWSPGQKP